MFSQVHHKYHVVVNGRLTVSSEASEKLKKAGYGVWKHATVELCHWARKELTEGVSCYKVKFYGVPFGGSHRCVEFSPTGMICHNKCIYCWRPTESYDYFEPSREVVYDPEEIVKGVLSERKRLLSGYFGNPKCTREKVKEALEPTHWAISLSGEPTLYPKISELIAYLKSLPNTKSIFIVSNGRGPEVIEKMNRENTLPTQLYLSLTAPNEEFYNKIHNPILHRENSWDNFLKSIELMNDLNTRTIIRLTLIKNVNVDFKYVDEFTELIKKANPHFVEIKSYMSLGHSLHYLSKENMLRHVEVREWVEKLLKKLNDNENRFTVMDEQVDSRIVVIQNLKKKVSRWIINLNH